MSQDEAPTTYRILIRGEVGPRFAAVFDNLLIECADGRSKLVGPVRDRAELNGIVNLLAALGADILSITSTAGQRGSG